jgi:hypothetical protein
MAAIKLNCAECGKEFLSYTDSYSIHCSVGCQMKKYEEHPPECPWHRDWHACNCGAFDLKEDGMSKVQIESRSKVVALDDGTFFIPIPDEIVKKLGLKEGDEVFVNETKVCEDTRETSGFVVSKVEDDEK